MTKEESKQTLAAENLAVDKEMERLMKSVKKGFYPAGKPLSKILERKWNEEMEKVYAGSPEILEIVLNPVIILIPDSPKDNLMVTLFFRMIRLLKTIHRRYRMRQLAYSSNISTEDSKSFLQR